MFPHPTQYKNRILMILIFVSTFGLRIMVFLPLFLPLARNFLLLIVQVLLMMRLPWQGAFCNVIRYLQYLGVFHESF
jgi:hypothetical protein